MTASAAPKAMILPALTASASAFASRVIGMIGPPRKMRSAPSLVAALAESDRGAIAAALVAAARNRRREREGRMLPWRPKTLATHPLHIFAAPSASRPR